MEKGWKEQEKKGRGGLVDVILCLIHVVLC